MDNERNIGVIRGASFYRENGQTMFMFGVDPNNVIGPRIATTLDKQNYPGDWAAFQLAHPSKPQLDHDKDGHPGGAHPPLPEPKADDMAQDSFNNGPQTAVELPDVPDDRAYAIRSAIASLLDEDMVKSGPRKGKPKVGAVATVTGFDDLTAEEIDGHLAG